jgi:hypothetical protein
MRLLKLTPGNIQKLTIKIDLTPFSSFREAVFKILTLNSHLLIRIGKELLFK